MGSSTTHGRTSIKLHGVAINFLTQYKEDGNDSLKLVITGDESWIKNKRYVLLERFSYNCQVTITELTGIKNINFLSENNVCASGILKVITTHFSIIGNTVR